jgi:hypothetical protein
MAADYPAGRRRRTTGNPKLYQGKELTALFRSLYPHRSIRRKTSRKIKRHRQRVSTLESADTRQNVPLRNSENLNPESPMHLPLRLTIKELKRLHCCHLGGELPESGLHQDDPTTKLSGTIQS